MAIGRLLLRVGACGLSGMGVVACSNVWGFDTLTGSESDTDASSDAMEGNDSRATDAPWDASGFDAYVESCDDTGVCAPGDVPTGWSPVAFSESRMNICPNGWTQNDFVEKPIAGSGACDCSCAITPQPTCRGGSLSAYYSSDTSCGSSGAPLNSGVGCQVMGGVLPSHSKVVAVGPGGSCTGSAVPNLGAITHTDGRECVPPLVCNGLVCSGKSPNGFSACIDTSGEVACPSSSVFQQRFVVGTDATLKCSACPSCILSATCVNPSVSFYSDSSCINSIGVVAANNTCIGITGGTVNSYAYNVTVANVSCAASGAKTATVDVSIKHTVCCR